MISLKATLTKPWSGGHWVAPLRYEIIPGFESTAVLDAKRQIRGNALPRREIIYEV